MKTLQFPTPHGPLQRPAGRAGREMALRGRQRRREEPSQAGRAPLPSRPSSPPLPSRAAPSQPGGCRRQCGPRCRWRPALRRSRCCRRGAGGRPAGCGGSAAMPARPPRTVSARGGRCLGPRSSRLSAELGRSREREEREGQEPPGVLGGARPPCPGCSRQLRRGSSEEAASAELRCEPSLLLRSQAALVPYVILGFSSKVLTSFPRVTVVGLACQFPQDGTSGSLFSGYRIT